MDDYGKLKIETVKIKKVVQFLQPHILDMEKPVGALRVA